MQKTRIICVAALTTAMFAGCAGPRVVPGKQCSNPPANYEAAIKAHLDQALKDPFSVQTRSMSKPELGELVRSRYVRPPSFWNPEGTLQYSRDCVWMVRLEVNAKNSYGGYTGWHDYVFSFSGEKLVDAEDKTAKTEAANRALQEFIRR